MAYHVTAEETLDPADLARLQRDKLAALLDEVLASNVFYREKYAGIRFDPQRDPLSVLPTTSRGEIERDQLEHPPYGTLLTYSLERYVRLHQTSGSSGTPLRWLDTSDSWDWWKHCWAIVYRAAELTASDRLAYPFSFGPFIGFWSAFESAAGLGNLVLPCGGMTTPARLRFILDHRVTMVCCTPTYALHMAEAAAAGGLDLAGSAVRALIVAGEPGGNIAGTRSRIESAWGAHVFDHAGMTEMGAWGFECASQAGGMHVMENEFIAEVVDPASGSVLPDGQAGELVMTNLGRRGMPLIRYRTGDQVVLNRARCRCGRWFSRAEGGIRGRIDDMLLIRGNNVFPSAIENILREFTDVAEFRLAVQQRGEMSDLTIEIEPAAGAAAAEIVQRVEATVRDRLHFNPTVRVVQPGVLPRFELKARRVVRTFH